MLATAIRAERFTRGAIHGFQRVVRPAVPQVSGDRFELLFSRASARSLDLKQLAGEASKIIPASSPRRRKFMEELFGAPIKQTVKGTSTRVARKGYSPTAELGQCLAGLNEAASTAAMYSFALDGASRMPLYYWLRESAAGIARREQWPERIPGVNGAPHHYQDELTALVLDADWLKPLFHLAQSKHNVNLYAIMMDVSEEIWQTKVTHYYVRILQPYETLLAQARGYVERELAGIIQRDAAEVRIDPTNPGKAKEIA